MLAIWNHLRARLDMDEKGASIVEYALLIALIAIVAIAVVTIVGTNTSDAFSTLGAGFP